jgi:hypothetical protein
MVGAMTNVQHFVFVELPLWIMLFGVVFAAVMMPLIFWLTPADAKRKAGE